MERGDNGNYHLQGYIEVNTPQRYSYFREVLNGAHFEARRGSRTQARDYCMKEDTRVLDYWEIGDWTGGQGARNDLTAMHEDMLGGMGMKELSNKYFGNFLRYDTKMWKWKVLNTPPRNWLPKVTLLLGPPGTGKTRYIMAHNDINITFWKGPSSKWFDGYDMSPIVVMDDYQGNWFPVSTLLRILDSTPLTCETKGAHVPFVPKEILISANYSIERWYNWGSVQSPRSALARRITTLMLFDFGVEPQTYTRPDGWNPDDNEEDPFPAQWESLQFE